MVSPEKGHGHPHSPSRDTRALGRQTVSPGSPVNRHEVGRPVSAVLSLRSFGRPTSSRLLSAKARPATSTSEAKSPRKARNSQHHSQSSPKSASAALEPSPARKASAVITSPWPHASTSMHAELPQQENETENSSAKPVVHPPAIRTPAEPRRALQESPST